jgi:hypothetical protein
MKKIILLLALASVTIFSYGQKGKSITWFNIAVKGGYGNSLLINNNIFSDENITPDFFTPSYSFGGRFGVNFGNGLGLSLEMLSYSFGQKCDIISNTISKTYTKEIKLKSLDKLILLRYASGDGEGAGMGGGYFEIGPKFTTVKSATQENTINTADDVLDKYATTYTNIVFGFGGALVKSSRFEINAGLRFNYGFKDIISTTGYDYAENLGLYETNYDEHKSTNPFSAQFMLEFNYYLGYFATSSCGKKTQFLLF